MPNLCIPRTLKEITPEWLTDAFSLSGAIKNTRVKSVALEPLPPGQAFTTQLARLVLDYTTIQADAPRTLICKLPTTHNPTLIAAKHWGIYRREVRFYQEMAANVPIRIPHPFFSSHDADTGNFILLLEDLSPARPGDQVGGCSITETELAVRNAALLHARWWNDLDAIQFPWLVHWNRHADYYQQTYIGSCFKVFRAWDSQFPPQVIDLCQRIIPYVGSIRNRLSEPPQTFVHMDFRLDNLMFGTTDNDFEFAVVDWQACHIGNGMCDMSYFVTGALEPEIRKRYENHLLEVYYSNLVDSGVTGYSFARCVYDYKLALLDRLGWTMDILATLDISGDRGRLLVETWFRRFFAALIDNNLVPINPM